MIGDTYQMQAEIIELQTRIAELSNALDILREERDNLVDASASLHTELEAQRSRANALEVIVGRLRLHIQQGVEL